MNRVHGGRLIARALRRHEVDLVFSLCGGHVAAIYDGCIDEGIRLIDVRHEQTAGFAADAHARLTGTPGVAVVTAGPGVTNVVTALANAQRAGVPLVCIGGAAPRSLLHMGSLQDLDSVTLVDSVCKWATRVPETRRLEEYVDRAFRISQSGVPGPVYLEVPLDLLMELGDAQDPPPRPASPVFPGCNEEGLAAAAGLLSAAERPCIVLGSELRWSPARQRLRPIAESLGCPIYLNGEARGALGPGHPALFSASRRHALERADLVLVLGTPFDFRLGYGRPPGWNPDARVIQVDLDPDRLGENRSVDVALHADVGLFLEAVSDRVETKKCDAWLEELRAIDDERRTRMREEMDNKASPPNPLRVCDELAQRLGERDVVIGDGGDFVATAAHAIGLEWPQVWMDPGPFGTLGAGPGYALAASLLRPESRVVVVFGDGAFGLNGMEFEALARHGCNVVAVIGNDAAWTQIRRGQVQLYGEERAIGTTLQHARYDEVVRALGGKGYWVERCEELGPALDGAFAAAAPACVNVRLAPTDFRKGSSNV